MLDKLIQNLRQFAGDRSVLNPSVLIPQQKINAALPRILYDVPQIRLLNISFELNKARVEAEVYYRIPFKAEMEIAPAGIELKGTFLQVFLKRLTPLRLESPIGLHRLALKSVEYYFQKIAKTDPLRKFTDEIPEVDVQENLIILRIELQHLIDNGTLPKSARWITGALEPRDLSFVEKGVRINFRVLPKFFDSE